MAEEGNERRPDSWIWTLLYVSLGGSAVSGGFTATTASDLHEEIARGTQDRYYASDATRDFALRDIRIDHISEQSRLRHEQQEQELDSLERAIQRILDWQDKAPPDDYEARIEQRLKRLEDHEHEH